MQRLSLLPRVAHHSALTIMAGSMPARSLHISSQRRFDRCRQTEKLHAMSAFFCVCFFFLQIQVPHRSQDCSCRDETPEKLQVHYILPSGAKKTVSAVRGDNLMDLAIANNIDIEGPLDSEAIFSLLKLF